MAKNKYLDVDDNGSDDKWKSKYYASLEEIENKEAQWHRDEEILRALIVELTDAADNSSTRLNKQLSVLKDAFNKGIAASKLKKAIEEISESINALNTLRERNKYIPGKYVVELISNIKPAGKIEKKLGKISSKISKSIAGDDLSPYIKELASLLVYGLSLASKKKEKGILSSLLDKKQQEDEEDTEEVNQEEILEQVHYLDAEIKEDLTNAVASLNGLLEKMILPADLQVEANLIKRKLAEGVDEETFIDSLEQTVVIISDVLDRVRREQKETEAFLKQLTSRLHELDSDIRETARISALTHKQGVELTDGMKNEMSGMEEGINNIENLEELKTAIQSRVILLRDHVDNFILKEGEKNREANQVIEQLKRQVSEMEKETADLRQQVEEERKQTLRDVLTELPNRLAYEERLDLALADFKRNKNPFVLVVWDIDFFKKVNDTYGHAAGDQVLKLVASILNKSMRETDFMARFGGEEFVSILPDTNAEGGQQITDKLRSLIESSNFHFRDKPVKITVSCGYAEIKENESGENLFTRADAALYRSKENGRNQCTLAN